MSASQKSTARRAGSVAPPGVHGVLTGLRCADNLPFMRSLPDGCCDLIYVDPPFDGTGAVGDGAPRNGDSGRTAPRSSLSGLLGFLRPRFERMHQLLPVHGSLYVHVDWRCVHYIKVMLDEVFGAGNFLNEIIWSYRSGGRPAPWFARKHDTILLYAKQSGRHTFNRMRGGEFRTRDLATDEQGRRYKSTRNGRIYFHSDGPILSDVWDIPFLSTVATERVDYPSQKPEALLERVILASSNEGDLVADFFCGSGTTLVVAKRLGRRCLGCDINPAAVDIARGRLSNFG